MKIKPILFLSILACVITGCHQTSGPFATISMSGSHTFMVKTDDPESPEGINPHGVENSYTLIWPQKGMMSREAERELILQVFGDSTASSVDEAAQRWLNNLWLFEETTALEAKRVDSINKQQFYTYAHLQNSLEENGELVTFINTNETFLAGAAHGMYIVNYLTYDRKKKRVVHLHDLVDTTKMGEVVLRAIEDLTVNKDVCDCLYDGYKNGEPIIVPDNFFIDSTRSTITVVFQQYDIAPYACGLQSVVMPIFWLSKHRDLTPYAKKVFGEDSYVREN